MRDLLFHSRILYLGIGAAVALGYGIKALLLRLGFIHLVR
jgi:hypothetical protein